MTVTCPNCQRKLEIDPARWFSATSEAFPLECPGCQATLRLALKVDLIENKPVAQGASPPASPSPSPSLSVRAQSPPTALEYGGLLAPLSMPPCPGQSLATRLRRADVWPDARAGHPAQADRSSLQVLVAVDGEATRELIREILVKGGYEVLETSTGREALSLLEKHHPSLALLDVGLPQIFGFEVCEVIKRKESLKPIKVVLVAAIYHQNSYKREPKTLYGADDYIERHRLQDELLSKIQKLLDKKRPDVSPPVYNDTPEHEAAKRLARIIVSDIALYNSERVKEALQKNCFYEMLQEEIEEGRKLYNERASAAVRSNTDYFRDAIENYIKSKAKG